MHFLVIGFMVCWSCTKSESNIVSGHLRIENEGNYYMPISKGTLFENTIDFGTENGDILGNEGSDTGVDVAYAKVYHKKSYSRISDYLQKLLTKHIS